MQTPRVKAYMQLQAETASTTERQILPTVCQKAYAKEVHLQEPIQQCIERLSVFKNWYSAARAGQMFQFLDQALYMQWQVLAAQNAGSSVAM